MQSGERYTLTVFDNKTTKKIIIPLMENGKLKTKVDITTIDLFFLDPDVAGGFYDRMEFRDYLLKNGYDVSQNFAVYITYISNQKNGNIQQYNREMKKKYGDTNNAWSSKNEKCLPIIYRDCSVMAYFAYVCNKLRQEYASLPVHNDAVRKETYNKIKTDEVWGEFYLKLATAMNSGKFNMHLRDKSGLSNYCYENISDYNRNKNQNSYEEIEAFEIAKKKVGDDLTHYKNIRLIQGAFMEYEKKFGYNFGLDQNAIAIELVIAKTNNHIAKKDSQLIGVVTKPNYIGNELDLKTSEITYVDPNEKSKEKKDLGEIIYHPYYINGELVTEEVYNLHKKNKTDSTENSGGVINDRQKTMILKQSK